MADWPKGFVMIFTLCVTLLLFAYVDHILPPTTIAPVSPFGTGGFNFALTFVAAHQIGTFAVTLAVVLAATAMIRYTRFGLFVRAIYDDPAGGATLGLPLGLYRSRGWAMGRRLAR